MPLTSRQFIIDKSLPTLSDLLRQPFFFLHEWKGRESAHRTINRYPLEMLQFSISAQD